MLKARLILRFIAPTLVLAWASVAAAQQSQGAWSGWARCEINVSGPGYTDKQTHTWTMTGGAPTVTGAFRVYPATWSVVGGGSLQRTQGSQTLVAQWSTTAENLSAPLAVFVRASDRLEFIQARHSQLRLAKAVSGYQQLTINGQTQMPGLIGAEAFEWAFPQVEVSVPKQPGAKATANGSSTPVVNGKVSFMQPGDAKGTASCTWQFGEGSAAPAPPPTVAAQAVPKPAAIATGAPAGQPAQGAGTCISAPRNLAFSIPTPNNVNLTWAAPASGTVSSYIVQAGSAPGLSNLANFNTGNSQPSLISSGVPSGSYYTRVLAQAGCGTSAASNEVLMVVP